MKKMIPVLVAIVVMGVLVFNNSEAELVPQKTPQEITERLQDIDVLATYVDIDKSYSEENRKKALEHIQFMRSNAATMSDAAFYLAVRKMAAIADNGHTNVGSRPVYQEFGAVPMRVYWFGDALHVVRAQSDLAYLLGARITHVAGRPIEDVVDVFNAYMGGNEQNNRSYGMPLFILSPKILVAAGIGNNTEAVEFTMDMMDGSTKTISLTNAPPSDGIFFGSRRPWRNLVATPISPDDTWVSALSNDVPRPIQLEQEGDLFFMLENIGEDVAYVNMRQNFSQPREDFLNFLKDVDTKLTVSKPKHIIVDVRHNWGGDMHYTLDFMTTIHALLPEDGLVFVITGKGTFSAGIYTAFFAKAANPKRTIVVGEHSGDRERFYAENGEPIRLPNSKYFGSTSRQLHSIEAGCYEDNCHIPANDPRNIAIGSIEPDMKVDESFADFMKGEDSVINAILNYLQERAGAQ